jgi:hypothetical protein
MMHPSPSRLAAVIGIVLLVAAGQPAQAQTRVWDFRALLDDAPIGSHRFTLQGEGPNREMKIETRFEVKILLITAYRYTHSATERWRGNCLESLTSRTDDDGTKFAVDAVSDGKDLVVNTGKGRETIAGCAMSFAYWNPEILRQSRLLNSQTGEYEAVKIADLGEDGITVRGAPVRARHYRITGPKNPIDLWYSAGNEWLALESVVGGGRKLRYTLN